MRTRQAAKRQSSLRLVSRIVAFVGEKRDIKLKKQLETLVRPIRVAPGQIEIALEAGALRRPAGRTGAQARSLDRHALDGAGGARGRREAARRSRRATTAIRCSARRASIPTCRRCCKRFPGAEIVDVREPEARATRQ